MAMLNYQRVMAKRSGNLRVLSGGLEVDPCPDADRNRLQFFLAWLDPHQDRVSA